MRAGENSVFGRGELCVRRGKNVTVGETRLSEENGFLLVVVGEKWVWEGEYYLLVGESS